MWNTIISPKFLEKILKIISLVVFLFLILNFIFNMGYFIPLGLKFFSMLSVRDYYEGTAPLLIFSLVVYGSVFNIPVFNEIVQDLPNCIKLAYETKIKLPNILKELEKDIKKSNITEEDRKNFQNRYTNTETEIKKISESNELKELNKYGIELLIITVCLPIFVICINSSYIPKTLLFLLCITHLCIILVFFIQKDSVKKFLLVLFTIFFIILLGLRQFVLDYNDLNVIGYFQNNQYYIIRPISKGYIVKDKNNSIKFIDLNQTVSIDNKVNNGLIKFFMQNQKTKDIKDRDKKLLNKISKFLLLRNKKGLTVNNEVEDTSYLKLDDNKIIEVKILIKKLNGDINE